MDCKEVEEGLASYLLGAMESLDNSKMNFHIDGCAACKAMVRRESELIVALSKGAPEIKAPARIKSQLMEKIGAEAEPYSEPEPAAGIRTRIVHIGRWTAAQSGAIAAAVAVVFLVYGVYWYSGRMDTIDDLKAALDAQITSAALDEAELQQKLRIQRDLTAMVASPDVSIAKLTGTSVAANSRGILAISATGTSAIISASNLPLLPAGRIYRIWLMRDGNEFEAGSFSVDEAGFGQAIVDLTDPLTAYSSIKITIERTEGSPSAIGESVMRGDL
ncbi:MAG: hypothetical protein FJ319_07635 [SAR202 cluster bacterium]|nr:hypothetical protein [SAR202 cluster bacterium]